MVAEVRVLLTASASVELIVDANELLTIVVMVELMALIAVLKVEEVSKAPLSVPAESKFPVSTEITLAEDSTPSSSV